MTVDSRSALVWCVAFIGGLYGLHVACCAAAAWWLRRRGR